MKNIIILLIALVALSCSSTKKVIKDQSVSKKWTETETTESIQSVVKIDTTKVSDMEVTYTRTEYYEPVMDQEPANPDTTIAVQRQDQSKKPPAVKSVEVLNIKKKTEEKGAVENIHDAKTETKQTISEETETDIKTTEKSKPVQLKYLFYIIILLLAGYLIYTKGSILKRIFRF